MAHRRQEALGNQGRGWGAGQDESRYGGGYGLMSEK